MPDRDRLKRYAWFNVLAGAFGFCFLLAVPAVLMPVSYSAIIADMGWSRGEVTTFTSFKFGIGILFAFGTGFIIERVGLKRLILIISVPTGLAMMSLYFVDRLVGLYMVGAVLGATAIVAVIGVKVLVARWFSARLGLAIGLAFLGGGIGGFFTPLIAHEFIETFGWRMTWVLMSFGVWFLLIPIWLVFAHDKPEAYGVTAEDLDPGSGERQRRALNGSEPYLRDVIRSKLFWLIVIAHLPISAVEHGMFDHTALFLERDKELGPQLAAIGFSILMLTSLIGRVGFGWLFDRLSMKGIAICWWLITLGVVLAFPVSGLTTLVLFTVVRGLSHGGYLVDIPVLAKHNFGTRSLSHLMALFTVSSVAGGAIGPVTMGYVHDLTGSYYPAFYGMIGLGATAGALVFFIRPSYRP